MSVTITKTGKDINKEIEYAQTQGQAGISTLTGIAGYPFLFVVHNKTVWLCDFSKKQAVCVLKKGKPKHVQFFETDETFIVKFTHTFSNTIGIVPMGSPTLKSLLDNSLKDHIMASLTSNEGAKHLIFTFEDMHHDDEIRWEVPYEFANAIQEIFKSL